jgi:hypothetical protein
MVQVSQSLGPISFVVRHPDALKKIEMNLVSGQDQLPDQGY